MEFFVAFREALWNFPRLSRGLMEFSSQDHGFKELRGFPGMELGIFRALGRFLGLPNPQVRADAR